MCRVADTSHSSRRSTHLREFDYSQPGAYFVTLCVRNRECLFGSITDATICLTDTGMLVRDTWREMPLHYTGLALDEFVIMPNHFHAIVMLTGSPPSNHSSADGRARGPSPTLGLHDIVQRFKSLTTNRLRLVCGTGGRYPVPLWQRGYHEHVIRNDGSLERIRQYIVNNPAEWSLDKENPDFIPPATPRADIEPWMV